MLQSSPDHREDAEMKEVGDVSHFEKEREQLKRMVAALQRTLEQQGADAEKLCHDLMTCIFILQNMEKQALQSQTQQIHHKYKHQDEQRLT